MFISKIDDKLEESSGLIWFDNRLWTFNDSGGDDEIYAINSSGKVKMTVELDGAKNNDWESITQDAKHIYIGDFGNNFGDRDDLRVYKIKKEKLDGDKTHIKVKAKKIKFTYKDQENFFPRPHAHEYDCEAMFSYKNKLHLFSKDWQNYSTRVFKLPQKPGDYELSSLGNYKVSALITGADISPNGKYFALLGYKHSVSYLYLFKYDPIHVFSKKAVMFDMRSIAGSQTEGICFIDDNLIRFSTEETDAFKQQVFSIDIRKYKKYLD